MTNQDRKTLAEALFAVAVENQSQKESRLATLEAENAKLRDLLLLVVEIERTSTHVDELNDRIRRLVGDIKSAIEPGNPGELKP